MNRVNPFMRPTTVHYIVHTTEGENRSWRVWKFPCGKRWGDISAVELGAAL